MVEELHVVELVAMCDCAAKLALLEQRLTALEAKKQPKSVDVIDFSLFWTAYPKKIGKKAAQKAFLNAQNRPRIDDLLQAIDRARLSEQWRKDGGQFIPHPATWLNQGRWDDEPVQIVPVQPKAQVKVEPRPVQLQEYEPPPAEFWEKVGRIGKSM